MGIENDKDSENVKKTETKKFYDVHCHAFNWSHLNVSRLNYYFRQALLYGSIINVFQIQVGNF